MFKVERVSILPPGSSRSKALLQHGSTKHCFLKDKRLPVTSIPEKKEYFTSLKATAKCKYSYIIRW